MIGSRNLDPMTLDRFHPAVASWFEAALGAPAPCRIRAWDALTGRPLSHPYRPSAGYSPPAATARYLADGEWRSGITG